MSTFSPYTDFPDMHPNVIFPRPDMQALSAVICALASALCASSASG